MNDLIVQVMTESEDWSYEEEYRLNHFEAANTIKNISPNTISEVILGCQINVNDKERILRLIENDVELNHVQVYQAEKHESEFRLELCTNCAVFTKYQGAII